MLMMTVTGCNVPGLVDADAAPCGDLGEPCCVGDDAGRTCLAPYHCAAAAPVCTGAAAAPDGGT